MQAELEEAVDSKVADLKAQVDEQAQRNIDNLSKWIDNIYGDL